MHYDARIRSMWVVIWLLLGGCTGTYASEKKASVRMSPSSSNFRKKINQRSLKTERLFSSIKTVRTSLF